MVRQSRETVKPGRKIAVISYACIGLTLNLTGKSIFYILFGGADRNLPKARFCVTANFLTKATP